METTTLTTLEQLVLSSIAKGRMGFFDQGFQAGSDTWSDTLSDDIARIAGISNNAAGGVISSLIKKDVLEAIPWSANQTQIVLTDRAIELHSELVEATVAERPTLELTEAGVVATDPRRLITDDGLNIMSFRFAAPVEAGDTKWFTVTASGPLATTEFAQNLRKGDRVHVEGTVTTHQWSAGDTTRQNREVAATNLTSLAIPGAAAMGNVKHLSGTGNVTAATEWTHDDRFHSVVKRPLEAFFRANLQNYAATTPYHEPHELIRSVKDVSWWKDATIATAVTDIEGQINAGSDRASITISATRSLSGTQATFTVDREALEWALVDVQARTETLRARYTASPNMTIAVPAPPVGPAR